MTDELQAEKEIVALEKKLRNEPGGKDYVEELRKLSPPDLANKLKDLAKYRQAILSTKNKDEGLKKAKAAASALELPYTQDLKGNAEKSRFIGLLIQDVEGFEPTRDLKEDESEE